MSKDNVVIEEGGMRYELGKNVGRCDLVDGISCIPCKERTPRIFAACKADVHLKCISATKIQPEPQPEPKMYFAWNREEASHLVGKMVEFHTGTCDSEWVTATLECIDNSGSPFLSHSTFGKIIRETKTTKLTLAQLIEMAGIEGDVEIVEEGE